MPPNATLSIIATATPQRDGYTLNPAGCVNVNDFADNGPVLWRHGASSIGAELIGKCIACWHEQDKLYAVTKLAINATPAAWSVGWLAVGPKTPGYVDRWRMFEYSATPVPIDAAAVTLKSTVQDSIDTNHRVA